MKSKQVVSVVIKMTMTALLLVVLSGCLYPQSDSSSTQSVSKEAIRNVQGAIEQYMDEKSVLPIVNSDTSVDRFEKFRVNFDILKREGYLEMLPRSSYEGGGNFYYLILNEETEPVVKAQSVYLTQKIIDIQRKVEEYQSKNSKLPLGDKLYEGFYAIDYKALNMKTPELHSLYSGSIVQLMLTEAGSVYIDYASDIYQAKVANPELTEDAYDDWRYVLILNSDYVPVKSPKYKLIDGEPIPYE